MTVRFDGKGKFYTNVISKDPVPATIQTITHRIHGHVYVRRGERLKDELNQDGKFIAVTDAVIFDSNGKKILNSEFLTVNRNHIVWLLPDEDVDESALHGGGE